MLIKDLVILGRACPEPLKDGRVTVCLAGWSETLGFVRLYPTRHNMRWQRWDVVEVEVEENERDNRAESWKIVGSRTEWERLPEKVKIVGRVKSNNDKRSLVTNLVDDCVLIINQQKRSLGIVEPKEIIKYELADNPSYGVLFQQGLPLFTELNDIQVKRDFEKEPRVQYRCSGCIAKDSHKQQVLEWGFYEWIRKNPGKADQIWENAGFDSPSTDLFFLVGNQAAHRNSFMVISVLRFKSETIGTKSMFPYKKYDEARLQRLLDQIEGE